jgi:magnesium-protoporphyrin O-methyltransferase
MTSVGYKQRRSEIEHYFDRTAAEAWKRLTSDAPVGHIRRTVRAGRDRMRATLLDWLPGDLHGRRLLDAGCGTGALAVEAARRGAEVIAVDLSPTLVELASDRASTESITGSIDFRVGDMWDEDLGSFDHVVAMDSLIHYQAGDAVDVLAHLARYTRCSIAFTFAPHTALLGVMHSVGRLFPRGDRAPAIVPVHENRLSALLASDQRLTGWKQARTQRISSGVYTSQAMELVAP